MTDLNDRVLLRHLAARVREIAEQPEMETRRTRWKNFNALKPERPMVLCFPEGAWIELLPDSVLQCRDPLHRQFEHQLRSKIYWWEHVRDDAALDPYFDLGWDVNVGDFGFDVPFQQGEDRGSMHWDAPMKDLAADLPKLHQRQLSVDRERTARKMERAHNLFGDLLPVRIHGGQWWTLGLTSSAMKLIGLENLMWAMMDQPDELHQLMAFLRDDAMNFITWCESEGLLTSNNGGGDKVASGGIGCIEGLSNRGTHEPVTLMERWGFAESQETVGVSPQMFEEFILPYQIPLLEKFGLNCYGCCEGMERRFDIVKQHIPRLRRISVAPMANQEMLARQLGPDYIFSRKPNPAPVCVNFNEDVIRQDIRQTLRVAGDHGNVVEMILKDTHTLENQPERLTKWIHIAYEEVDACMSGKLR